jgi:hypothetical protein
VVWVCWFCADAGAGPDGESDARPIARSEDAAGAGGDEVE